jgi:hypothetical protein
VIKPHPGVTAVCPHPHGNGLAIDGLAKFAERHGAGNDQHFAQKSAERVQSGSVTQWPPTELSTCRRVGSSEVLNKFKLYGFESAYSAA